MTEPAKRSCWWVFRPRYGLRALFVAMTLVACGLGWLGWDLKIIRERRAMTYSILSRHGMVIAAEDYPYLSSPLPSVPYKSLSRVPFHRAWLGDEAAQAILLTDGEFNREEIEEIRATFSEANIILSGKEYTLLRAAP